MNISRKNSIGFTVRNLRTHRRFCRVVGCAVSFFTAAMSSAPAFAATAVLGGSASLDQATGATLSQNTDAFAQFTSSSASAVLDWSKFNIGSGQEMNFNGAGTTFFNLVNATAGKSQIDGMISGNGSVWVINPSGIAFGANSTVNVGGLFAAAAGNIENADALRNGTATMPSFSSFEGAVSSASSSKFTANQVAMLGKTASVAGDFTGVSSLNIGAAGSMIVDEVGGGNISINVSDFAFNDAEVSLGDLDVGGSLSVKSAGAIMSQSSMMSSESDDPMMLLSIKTGSKIQAGDINLMANDDLEVDGKLQSTEGNISLLARGNLDVNAEVEAYGGVALQSYNDIVISDNVTAQGGATGAGGVTAYAIGDVTVNDSAEIRSVGSVDITSGMGNGVDGAVTIDGLVKSSSGSVSLYSGYGSESEGDIVINGEVSAAGNVDAYAGFGYALGTRGSVTVNGNVTGGSSVKIRTGKGDISIGKNAVVEATGISSVVNVYTAADAGYGLMSGEGHEGDIVIDGTVRADNVYGIVDVVAGKEIGASGSVALNGTVTSDYYSELATRTGNITVNGSVSSLGEVAINTGSGNIHIAEGSHVESVGGSQGIYYDVLFGYAPNFSHSVGIYAAMSAGGRGEVQIDGTVVAENYGNVRVTTGFDGSTGTFSGGDGNIAINGVVAADGFAKAETKKGSISVSGNLTTENGVGISASDGNVEVGGTIKTMGSIAVKSSGDIIVKKEGGMYSQGDSGWIQVAGESAPGVRADVKIDGRVVASGVQGTVDIIASQTEGSVGDISISGEVKAGNQAVVYVANGKDASGNLILDGMVEGRNLSQLQVGNGNVIISKTGKIQSVEGNAGVFVESGTMEIDGQLQGKGIVLV